MEKLQSEKILFLVLNSVSLIVLIMFSYHAYYELFICKPNIHYPRIGTFHEIFGSGNARFIFNVPTLCNLQILIVSIISIYAVVMIYLIKIIPLKRKTNKFWIIQIAGISICRLCVFIEIIDFMNTSFGGVG